MVTRSAIDQRLPRRLAEKIDKEEELQQRIQKARDQRQETVRRSRRVAEKILADREKELQQRKQKVIEDRQIAQESSAESRIISLQVGFNVKVVFGRIGEQRIESVLPIGRPKTPVGDHIVAISFAKFCIQQLLSRNSFKDAVDKLEKFVEGIKNKNDIKITLKDVRQFNEKGTLEAGERKGNFDINGKEILDQIEKLKSRATLVIGRLEGEADDEYRKAVKANERKFRQEFTFLVDLSIRLWNLRKNTVWDQDQIGDGILFSSRNFLRRGGTFITKAENALVQGEDSKNKDKVALNLARLIDIRPAEFLVDKENNKKKLGIYEKQAINEALRLYRLCINNKLKLGERDVAEAIVEAAKVDGMEAHIKGKNEEDKEKKEKEEEKSRLKRPRTE